MIVIICREILSLYRSFNTFIATLHLYITLCIYVRLLIAQYTRRRSGVSHFRESANTPSSVSMPEGWHGCVVYATPTPYRLGHNHPLVGQDYERWVGTGNLVEFLLAFESCMNSRGQPEVEHPELLNHIANQSNTCIQSSHFVCDWRKIRRLSCSRPKVSILTSSDTGCGDPP